MKLFLLFLILSSQLVFAQSKGETKIYVQPTDTSNLFNKVVSYLYANGYTLEAKDEQFKFIATNERAMEKYEKHQMKIRVSIKENILIFSGEVYVYSTEPNKVFTPIYYRTNKLTFGYEGW